MFKDKTASEIYLLSLQSSQSRITMDSLLNVIAQKFQKQKRHQQVDWSQLNYQVILMLMSELSQEKKSPATIKRASLGRRNKLAMHCTKNKSSGERSAITFLSRCI